MNAQAITPQPTLAEMFFQVYRHGSLNSYHRQQLRATLLKEIVSEEEQAAINRLLYAVRRGWLRVVD